jgi:poly(3-hydroxybutyrate) depolymerase
MTHTFDAVTKQYLRFELGENASSVKNQTFNIAEIEVYNEVVSTAAYAAAFTDVNGNLMNADTDENGVFEFMDCDLSVSVKITNPGLLAPTDYVIYGERAEEAPVELDAGSLNLPALDSSAAVNLDLSNAIGKACAAISVKTADGTEIGRLERVNDGFESVFVKGKFDSVLQPGKSMAYRLRYPTPDNPANDGAYPLVTYLHGTGSQGSDNLKPITMEKKGQPEYSRSLMYQLTRIPANAAYNGYILVPQCPAGDLWASEGQWASGEYSVDAVAETSAMKLYLELLETICANEKVDRSRLYITGFSMGGFGTFDAVARRPDLFAAAAPVAGGFDVSKAAALRDVPFRIYHNDTDTVVASAGSRAMYAALTAAGGIAEYIEWTFATGGVYSHNAWQPTYDTDFGGAALYAWLFAQKKRGLDSFTVSSATAAPASALLRITADVVNNNPQSRRAVVLAAVYNKESKQLAGVSALPEALYAAGSTPVRFDFETPKADLFIQYACRIYVWRDSSALKPLSLGADAANAAVVANVVPQDSNAA